MEWWHWLLLIGILAAIAFMVLKWRKRKTTSPRAGFFEPAYRKGITPNGVQMFGVRAATVDEQSQIDRGLAKAFARAVEKWGQGARGLSFAQYQVAIITNTAPKGQPPSFEIAKREMRVVIDPTSPITIPGYDGSMYDLDPQPNMIRIRVAGRFFISHKGGPAFYNTEFIWDQINRSWNVNWNDYWMRAAVVEGLIEEATEHEAWHALSLMNDPEFYAEEAIHV